MCDIKAERSCDESSDSEEMCLDDRLPVRSAKIIANDGLRIRFSRHKTSVKTNIKEEFIKKGFEVTACVKNSQVDKCEERTNHCKFKNENFDQTSYIPKDEPLAPYLCEVIQKVEKPSELLKPPPLDPNPFHCAKCIKKFPRLQLLKQHQMVHSDLKPFACTDCPRKFKKASHLKTHKLTHSEDSPYKCEECNKKFTQDASLKAHMRKHAGIRPYLCKHCGKDFPKLFSLQRHELTHNEEYKKRKDRILEKICDKDVIDADTYNEITTNIRELKKNLTAEFDRNLKATSFKEYKQIVNELSNGLKNIEKERDMNGTENHANEKEDHIAPYLCEVVEGSEDPNHNQHDDKAFQCPKCYKRFSRLTYLKQHQMTHSDYKPFPCTECPMRFKKASHLKTHTLTHTEDSPYKCIECNKKFTQDASLKSHMLVHSGIKPYGCKDCGKKFTKLYTLQRHELTHTEDRPFQCVLCFKKFSDISNLKRHELTHTNNKPYKCLLCNKNFSQLTHLKRHKLTHDIKGQEMIVVKIEPSEMGNI